jgi:guanosine-3',5'-bis(diphosphate) 3'-pyrophosphohydrolase
LKVLLYSANQHRRTLVADKTCNLASILVDPPQDWSIRRQQEYFEWAEQVIQGLLGVNERLDASVKDVLAQGKSAFQAAEPLHGP